MRLGVRVGEECARILNDKMRNLNCIDIQIDEIWGFIGKKQKNVQKSDPKTLLGDAWTFIALDSETKLVAAYRVGKRDSYNANAFIADLASRLTNRIQLSSDQLVAYPEAVERGFGGQVDYAQIVKTYSPGGADDKAGMSQRKYSPPEVVKVTKKVISGKPEKDLISTSYIERQNLSLRMNCRRLTRLTNAFSKKLRNFKAAVALNFCVYNFVRIHSTIHATPAMAAGVAERPWTMRELVELTT
jgi:IS1 family transposase